VRPVLPQLRVVGSSPIDRLLVVPSSRSRKRSEFVKGPDVHGDPLV